MTQSVDTDEVAGPPPSDGLSLIGETKAFLKAWQRILLAPPRRRPQAGQLAAHAAQRSPDASAPADGGASVAGESPPASGPAPIAATENGATEGIEAESRATESAAPESAAPESRAAEPFWPAEEVAQLRERARELEARARAANVTSLAQHLQSCEHCFWNGEVDRAKLIQSLRNVSEVAWQWRQDLRTRSDVFLLELQSQVPHDRLTIEPPTLLTPPSIEMFQSSPPPRGSDWPEVGLRPSEPPAALESEPSIEPPWAKRSVSRRWFGAGAPSDPPPPSSRPLRPASTPPRKGPFAFPSLSDAVYSSGESSLAPSSADAGGDSELPEAASREAELARRSSGFRWWSATAGVAAVAAVALLLSLYGGPTAEGVTSEAVSSALRRHQRALPRELIDGLLADAHRYGGIESPELADLLDGEAAELRDSGGACLPGAIGCELIHAAALAPAPSSASAALRAASAPGSWLDGLELPRIGVRDDARVRQVFEFHTRNSVGREAFQDLLFRCGAHRALVEAALARYGMPPELLALPMATSGCNADSESDGGARGLWQLTPAAARAYHLRVKAQVVDERVDPAKSTDAGVRLLEDLQRKLGSWELGIAAFQVGPLAIIAHLRDAGEGASYWALDESGVMPSEAAKYVPKVQAFALILANLAKFRFQPAPEPPAEETAELEVPPGTRLGLVARAVASSASRIRELNPDVLGDRVPDWPGERFVLRVPSDAGGRARETLRALIAAADHADECVPLGFDWGRQRFTRAMASRCEPASQR